jgi:uncharacterized SAM-binding protein YcdF (DUF218 family)
MLFHRRTVWLPTPLGAALLLAALIVAGLGWWFGAEAFLRTTERLPADVIVVEAWLQEDGARAAAREFLAHPGQYKHIVGAGGLTGEAWSHRKRWDQVEVIRNELGRLGIRSDVFIPAKIPDLNTHRTYASAVAARDALAARGIHPQAINVITLGVHARRSRLTFARAFGSRTEVGVIAWQPPEYDSLRWWDSSSRASDMLKESVGYIYELLLHSGRLWRGEQRVELRNSGVVSSGGRPVGDTLLNENAGGIFGEQEFSE